MLKLTVYNEPLRPLKNQKKENREDNESSTASSRRIRLLIPPGPAVFLVGSDNKKPTIWYVRPAKPQISLRIREV